MRGKKKKELLGPQNIDPRKRVLMDGRALIALELRIISTRSISGEI